MEIESICWLVLFIILIVIELATMGLTTIWFAGGSVAGFIISVLNGNIILQILAFVIVTVVLLVFTRPFAVRYVNKNRAKTNVYSLIGKKAIVTKAIDNLLGQGQAVVNGLEWTARTDDDKVKIAEGKTVVIERISGVKLIVKEKEN